MKCLLRLAVCLLLALPASVAWSQRSSYDPAEKQQSKPREGFVDFALKQINPQNTDYGCQMDEARKLLVDQTIKSIDSWAVLVALTFLVLSFFMLWHQHRERNRREVIAAEFLAQYHNAWMDARPRQPRQFDTLTNWFIQPTAQLKRPSDTHRLISKMCKLEQSRLISVAM